MEISYLVNGHLQCCDLRHFRIFWNTANLITCSEVKPELQPERKSSSTTLSQQEIIYDSGRFDLTQLIERPSTADEHRASRRQAMIEGEVIVCAIGVMWEPLAAVNVELGEELLHPKICLLHSAHSSGKGRHPKKKLF